MIPKLSTKTLVKIAGYGGIIVSITGIWVQHNFQSRLMQTNICKEAMQILRDNKKVLDYLGEPIRTTDIKVGDYEQNMRWLTLDLKGSKTKGTLRCDFVPNVGNEKPSQLYRVEIEFNDRPGINYVLRENVVEE